MTDTLKRQAEAAWIILVVLVDLVLIGAAGVWYS